VVVGKLERGGLLNWFETNILTYSGVEIFA